MPTVDVFYSFRSPFCCLLTPRLVTLEKEWPVRVAIQPVYPIAVRNPDFFARVDPLYRPYHMRDSARLAEHFGLPYRRPVPDPIVQDLETGKIADEQPYIRRITRLGMAAAETDAGLAFVREVMPLLWNGRTDHWHEGSHLADAMVRAGLDSAEMEQRASEDAAALDSRIDENQTAQREAGHWGVPLMVLDGEPFYGQDRFPLLLWRLEQSGLARRSG
jgi:2-hydroxychromene-2-carboxylate isomerase